MKRWSVGSILLFFVLINIPAVGIFIGLLYAWLYCTYLDNK